VTALAAALAAPAPAAKEAEAAAEESAAKGATATHAWKRSASHSNYSWVMLFNLNLFSHRMCLLIVLTGACGDEAFEFMWLRPTEGDAV
jgi:hypothetical protein